MNDHITHLELAVIAALLFPQAIEKVRAHWKPVKNWLERRAIHKRSLQ